MIPEPGIAGDVAGRPVAVAAAMAAPRTLAGWIEDKHAPFALTLAAQPGFIAGRLLQCLNNGRRCLIISLTLWEDVAWFRAWQSGTGFAAACAAFRGDPDGSRAARAEAGRYAMLDQARFDFPFPRAGATRTMARLEGPLLARLAERYGTDTQDAAFRILLDLPELVPGSTWGAALAGAGR
jgi:heme-degrading monooxygenase HmoA